MIDSSNFVCLLTFIVTYCKFWSLYSYNEIVKISKCKLFCYCKTSYFIWISFTKMSFIGITFLLFMLKLSDGKGFLRRLLLKPGPGPWKTWTRTLKNLDPEKPGLWRTCTLKNLDPEKPEPWKTWETAGYGKMIRRPHIITY